MSIDQLIKEATLSKDKIALNAYKNLKAEFQKVLTAKNGPKELDYNAKVTITAKYAKSLEDAIKQFSEAHRDDLVSEYTNELEVVKKLLPEPVNESEIYDELADWYAQFYKIVGNVEIMKIPKKEMGTVIKYLKSKFPTADGKMISDIVKSYII